jgi:hypothetical protein
MTVGRKHKAAAASAGKRDLRQGGPLRAGLRGRGAPHTGSSSGGAGGANDDATWLQQCEQLYASLPKSSAWARHKLKVGVATQHAQVLASSRVWCAAQQQGGGGELQAGHRRRCFHQHAIPPASWLCPERRVCDARLHAHMHTRVCRW